jgi:hypothetical protein
MGVAAWCKAHVCDTHMHICTYIRTYAYIHTHTHTHTPALHRRWHHVAITWSSTSMHINDYTYTPAGTLRIYIDCLQNLGARSSRAAQSTAPGGAAKYECKKRSDKEQWAWEGVMGPGRLMSTDGELSLGQSMTCNASTHEQQLDRQRVTRIGKNATFCRRDVAVHCDVTFNTTVSPYIPGIYAPEGDCTPTVLGMFLSAGQNLSSCVRDPSDPYTTIKRNSVMKRMAADWMWSNDVYPTSGQEGPPYSIPYMSDTQLQVGRMLHVWSTCLRNLAMFLDTSWERIHDALNPSDGMPKRLSFMHTCRTHTALVTCQYTAVQVTRHVSHSDYLLSVTSVSGDRMPTHT